MVSIFCRHLPPMVVRYLPCLTVVAQDNHHQDPEDFYVKQDRIGAQILRYLPGAAPLTQPEPRREGILWRGLQGVRPIARSNH